jgi:hypothetical protein
MGSSTTERVTYAFEHAMAHRTLYAAMSPLSRFSVLPYLIDPQQEGGKYLQNHQQAHWDAITTIPTFPPEIGVITNPDGSLTIPSGGIGLSSNPILFAPELDKLWNVFANHTAHYNAMTTLPVAENQIFPFW